MNNLDQFCRRPLPVPQKAVQLWNAPYPYNNEQLNMVLYDNEKQRDDLYGYINYLSTPGWGKNLLTKQFLDSDFQGESKAKCVDDYVQSAPMGLNMYDMNALLYERNVINSANFPQAQRWQARQSLMRSINNQFSKTKDPYMQPMN